MPNPLANKTVALAVSGSIACYKAVDLASKLVQAGALVDVLMTEDATRFVTPLAFGGITHRPVVHSLDPQPGHPGIDHVETAERADVVVVAPATANTIAKMALGLADDAVSTTVLATRAPVIVCPGNGRPHVREPRDERERREVEVKGLHDRRPGRRASGLGAARAGAAAGARRDRRPHTARPWARR